MKFKSLLFALLVIPLVASAVHAQNLFRTGRPDYTRADYARNYPATYHDRYVANSYANDSYARNTGPLTDPRLTDPSYDRQRLDRAWENYRLEPERYRARYGSNHENGYGATPSTYNAIRTVDYQSDYAPNRRCTSLKPDLLRDRLPSTSAPTGSYFNPSYYGNENGNGFGNSTDPYGNNLNRTASRPLVSLFDSLFGTNR